MATVWYSARVSGPERATSDLLLQLEARKGSLERPYRILACTSPAAERRLRQALPADELQMALTFSDACKALLHERWDVVIIGALFDESRALELMQLLRFDQAYPKVSIIGIRGAKIARSLQPEIFDMPMRMLGALDVIDFGSIPDNAAGNAQIGTRIRAAVSG